MTNKYLTRDLKRYSKISPGTVYEDAVQHIVLRNIESIFPGFVGRRIDPYFKTAAGDVKPDLVMINREMTEWGLIEVEIDNHSFSAHVLPQMAKLSFAKADQSVINKVSDAFEGEFHFDKIQSLLEKKPIVYLVTHGNTEKYQDKLDELYVSSIDIEIHSCPPGDYVIEVNDRSKKYLDTGWQAIRSRSPLLKNLWNISSFESEIPSDLGGQIAVEYENTISIWSFEKFGSSLALRAPADLPMSPHIDKVEVYKQKDAWVFKMKVNDHIDRSNNAAKNG